VTVVNHRTYITAAVIIRPEGGNVVAGRPLDDAVVTELFKRLSPPSLAIVREEAEHARSDDALHEHQRITALNQARQRVAHLELRFLSVDPAHHLVKESLEARLEQEKRELKKLEQASHEGVRAVVPLDGDDFAELVRLCGAVQEIFYAKTTTARDRKSIIGSLIDHIVVESRNPEAIAARIVWKDGAPDLHPRGTPKTGQ
jgi:hypothetical protein